MVSKTTGCFMTESDLSRQVRELSLKLARFESERAIIDTIQRYAFAIDDGLDEEWLDCFTEDGVFEVKTRFEVTLLVRGQANLRPFIAGHTKAPTRWHKHITTSHRILVDGNNATAQSYILRVDNDDNDDVPKIWVFGRYLDDLTLGGDGRWRFRHRTISLEGVQPSQQALMRGMIDFPLP
jgi:3-phenylpropionate/cinnamic acid dioxygenase small subunit